MTPEISVIIPCYNTERYVASAIESVLAQTYHNFEIIVIDDGSTDTSWQVIQQFKDDRIRPIQQANKGLSATRNVGIAEARGEYLVFLDADDEILPDKLRLQVEFLKSHPEYTSVAGGTLRITDTDEVFFQSPPIDAEITLMELLIKNRFPPLALMHRRDSVVSIGGFDESLTAAEDWDLYLQLALSGGRIFQLPELVCRYRAFPGTMSTHPRRQTEQQLRVIEKTFKHANLPAELTTLQPVATADTYLSGTLRALLAGDMDLAREYWAAVIPRPREREVLDVIIQSALHPSCCDRDQFFDFAASLLESDYPRLTPSWLSFQLEKFQVFLTFKQRRLYSAPGFVRLCARHPISTIRHYAKR